MEKINTMQHLHGKTDKSPIYGMTVTYDIQLLNSEFKNKYIQLYPKYSKYIDNESKEPEKNKLSATKSAIFRDSDYLEDEKKLEKVEISSNNVNAINSDESIDLNTSITSNDINDIKQHIKKSKKRVPNKLAKKLEEGYSMISENSGVMYKVVKTLKGHKRWKKVSQKVSI